jgi:primosomal protein N' (replication factor Y)
MIRPCGPGVERIYEEITNLFPNAKTHIITKDETRKPDELDKLLKDIHDNKIDILIGTQIITKGYDFPTLSLVGVIDADVSLMSSDLKSTEKTFQLLQQVGGRAGRRSEKGYVYIQTYYKDNFILNLIKSGDFDKFYENELKIRQERLLPPFAKSALILVSCKIDLDARKYANQIVYLSKGIDNIKILGPAHNDIAIINKKHIYKIFIITPKTFNIQTYLANILSRIKTPSRVTIKCDIDPYRT